MKRKLIAVMVAVAVAVLAGAGTAVTAKAYDPKEAVISTEGMGYDSNSVMMDGVPGQEYIIVEKGTTVTEDSWADAQVPDENEGNSVLFTDLTPATGYEIYTRVAATASEKAGEPVHISVNTSLYGISFDFDSDLVGSTITVYPEPEELTGYTYQWYQDDVTTDEDGIEHHDLTEIRGETEASYTCRKEDAGKHLAVKIYREGIEVGDASTMWPVAASATVTFDYMGGGSTVVKSGLSYHEKIEEPETPVRAGYDFDGWYQDSTFYEKWDFDKDLVEWSEIALYAKWNYRNDCAKDASCPVNRFNDMTPTAWYHDGVHYALDNGIMNGVGNGQFLPDAPMNRAMMAQVLYNMAPVHGNGSIIAFPDVAADAWYAEAIRWVSAEASIIGGTGDGNYEPEKVLTREQMVQALYNYAWFEGRYLRIPDDGIPSVYTDAAEVREESQTAMSWAVYNGLINGKTATTLNPKDPATRAEIATVIMRYLTKEWEAPPVSGE